ncbi:hypothetical protein A0J61_11615, partial [Choanephora cucurbitarum]
LFCTIPESVVCLDTPKNATAYRPPYPIPIALQEIMDKQTNGKGETTGYRVCHDPRMLNLLLKSIDRMPLPVIGELFEHLNGAVVIMVE